MTQGNGFSFIRKLWQRSQNSYATTVPQEILNIKGVPVDENVEVNWRINETGEVTVSFKTVDGDDDE
ncbi:hypothetical protein [Natrarchaeobius chitinivorans]|uniref:hypothetical protein n=1 Tax=Natrarchaeobius chitinivorans TaxID=1679083 RepID=UPI000F543776|nr:hypothetical protein [Natrarchaeobius chitinivorans]